MFQTKRRSKDHLKLEDRRPPHPFKSWGFLQRLSEIPFCICQISSRIEKPPPAWNSFTVWITSTRPQFLNCPVSYLKPWPPCFCTCMNVNLQMLLSECFLYFLLFYIKIEATLWVSVSLRNKTNSSQVIFCRSLIWSETLLEEVTVCCGSRLQLKVKVLGVKVMDADVAVFSSAAVAADINTAVGSSTSEQDLQSKARLTFCRRDGKLRSWLDRSDLWPCQTPLHKLRGRTWKRQRFQQTALRSEVVMFKLFLNAGFIQTRVFVLNMWARRYKKGRGRSDEFIHWTEAGRKKYIL